MCSVFGILDIKSDAAALRPIALEMSKKLRHRGPDWSGIYSSDRAILAHERLAIVGLNSGAQPLYSPDNKLIPCGKRRNLQPQRDPRTLRRQI